MKTLVSALLFTFSVAIVGCGDYKSVPADETHHHALSAPQTRMIEPQLFVVVREPQLDAVSGFWNVVVRRDTGTAADNTYITAILPEKRNMRKGVHVRLYSCDYWVNDARFVTIYTATE